MNIFHLVTLHHKLYFNFNFGPFRNDLFHWSIKRLDLKYDVTIATAGVFLDWAFCFLPAEGNLAIWDAYKQRL